MHTECGHFVDRSEYRERGRRRNSQTFGEVELVGYRNGGLKHRDPSEGLADAL